MASDLPRVRALLLDGELSRRGWLDRGHLEKTLTPSGLVENARLSSLVTCLTTELWIQGMSPVLGDRPAPTASPA